MRILLIGAAGQLGRALGLAFAPGHRLIESVPRDPTAGQILLDLASAPSVRAGLETTCPEVILVAGAMCNVDLCEQEPDRCRQVNVEGVRWTAHHAARHGSLVVLFSTDHVFDGERPAYDEDDAVHPLNVYAASKVEGEILVRALLPEAHLVLRTSWLYGPDPKRRNFALRLRDRLSSGEQVPVPADQWGSPTYTEDVAAATRHLVELGYRGTFHATGPEFVDRLSLARHVCARFGLDSSGITPRATAELRQPARRPLGPRLRTGKLHALSCVRFRRLEEGLAALCTWDTSSRQR